MEAVYSLSTCKLCLQDVTPPAQTQVIPTIENLMIQGFEKKFPLVLLVDGKEITLPEFLLPVTKFGTSKMSIFGNINVPNFN